MNVKAFIPIVGTVALMGAIYLRAMLDGRGTGADADYSSSSSSYTPDKPVAANKDADPKGPATKTSLGEFIMPRDGGAWPWAVGSWPELEPVPVSLTKEVTRE